jgi:rubrerythrin
LNAKTIQFNNEHIKPVLVMENTQNLNYYEPFDELQQQQNYFLICESCFWMASTLNYFKLNNISPTIYKECPICENNIDRFSIPIESN